MRRIERENTGIIRPGQDLVVAGYAGLSGTIQIANYRKEELNQWFSKDYIKRILDQESKEPTYDYEALKLWGATEWELSGEGGILKTLWDLSGAYMTGIRFYLRRIPVKQETIELCERYDLNPYRLFSKSCLLLTADNGADLLEAMKENGIHGAVIGKVTKGIGRIIDHGEGVGYLDRPTMDERYKVME